MKNRYIPYGYEMSGGIIGISKTESAIVRWIYNQYLDGRSLKDIAERLAEKKIEYLPGQTNWSKNRVKRILEDTRYHRIDTYPIIINEEFYTAAIQIMAKKNNKKDIKINDEVNAIKNSVICLNCEQPLKRWYIGKRIGIKEHWRCTNTDCGLIVKISDNTLLKSITDTLNELIGNSALVEPDEILDDSSPSLESKKLTNEIYRQIGAKNFDKEQLKKQIFECAAIKYNDILSVQHITEKLKADFEKSSLLLIFNKDLYIRTVSHIKLNADGNIVLILKNGKNIERIIRDEHNYNTEENGNFNTAPSGANNGQPQSIPATACCGILPCIH